MINTLNNVTYSPVCDIVIFIICISFLLNIKEQLLSDKRKSFIIARTSAECLMVAIAAKLCFESLYQYSFGTETKVVYSIFYDISRMAYILQLYLMIEYFYYLLNIENTVIRNIGLLSIIISYALILICSFMNFNIDIFYYVCLYFLILIVTLVVLNRKRIISSMYTNIITALSMSTIIFSLNIIKSTESFISISFIIPLLTVILNVNSNSFDIVTGAYNYQTFINNINKYNKKDNDFTLVNITFMNLSNDSLTELKSKLFNFYDEYIKRGKLYEINDTRYVVTFKKKYNENTDEAIKSVTDILKLIADSYRADYKIIVIENGKGIKPQLEYLHIIDYFEKKENIDTISYINNDNITYFRENSIIVNEIQHISHEQLLNTDIVKAYYQPIFNIKEKRIKSAEALMRMEIPEIGFIYPDRFIKVAEDTGIIHRLSLVMLNKVCIELKKLLDDNYDIDRISVNFSIMELRDEAFLDDIKNIIDSNEIPYSKIAIELTESKTDKDFELVKDRVNKLKEMGMNIYLDDFGTGYSNIERIMRLPLDTIKFDRSMLMLSHENQEYKYLVSNMVKMFSNLKYTILFEGVENDLDEDICKDMQAEYLQGYKYSKPIPIEYLKQFLNKKDNTDTSDKDENN